MNIRTVVKQDPFIPDFLFPDGSAGFYIDENIANQGVEKLLPTLKMLKVVKSIYYNFIFIYFYKFPKLIIFMIKNHPTASLFAPFQLEIVVK